MQSRQPFRIEVALLTATFLGVALIASTLFSFLYFDGRRPAFAPLPRAGEVAFLGMPIDQHKVTDIRPLLP